jgi:MFS family permease
MIRSIGAAIFGLAGDLYGRKWPMIINLLIIAVLQLATAYCETFSAFLGVRALFGIGMGGIWGLSASMALESIHLLPFAFIRIKPNGSRYADGSSWIILGDSAAGILSSTAKDGRDLNL